MAVGPQWLLAALAAALLLHVAVPTHAESSLSEVLAEECVADGGGSCDAGLGLLQLRATEVRQAQTGADDAGEMIWSRAAGPAGYAHRALLEAKTDNATTKPFDCVKKPEYCGAPLHCDEPGKAGTSFPLHETAYSGHSNLKAWCSLDEFREGVVNKCLIDHDLSAGGRATYQEQVRANALEADASYCFLVGHCLEDRVTNDTTIEEAEELCDEKYGRKGWTSYFDFTRMMASQSIAFGLGQANQQIGFTSRSLADGFGKLACAMGNWHCDVIYCRENYCNNEHFKGRYQRYLFVDP